MYRALGDGRTLQCGRVAAVRRLVWRCKIRTAASLTDAAAADKVALDNRQASWVVDRYFDEGKRTST